MYLYCLLCLEIRITVLVIQDKLVVFPLDFEEKERCPQTHTHTQPQFPILHVFKMDILLRTDICMA